MAYNAWSVVFGEQPTAAKWNQLGTNDAGFKDGTNIDDGAITAAKIANRTRAINVPFFSDGTGGSASSINLGMPAVAFTGTPSGFLRANTIIPADYVAGTDVVLRLKAFGGTGATHTARRYVNADAAGDSLSSLWDVDSNVQTTGLVFSANILRDIDITVAAANIAADSLVSMAWRIETAITGTIWVENVSLRYTADS